MNLLYSLLKKGPLKWLPLVLLSLFVSIQVQAETQPDPSINRVEVEQQRNPDYACTQCHKSEASALHGKHAGAINPNNQLPITCTNCHGNISLEHRNGVADAMRFKQDKFRIDQQNSVCLSCHQPEKLREVFWQHDVHMMKLSCASCHNLHPTIDPMRTLDHKGQIKLCVDCHSQQHKQQQKIKVKP